MQQGLFQGSFCGLGSGSVCQLPAEHFTRATVDDRHEGAPTVVPAVHRSIVGGPALVGCLGDGFEMLNARPKAGATLSASPTVQLHDAVDLFPIDDHALAFGEAGMGHAHTIGGMSFNDRTDGPDAERVALRLKVASTWLVIGGGACHAE